jgi:hypothetical protein
MARAASFFDLIFGKIDIPPVNGASRNLLKLVLGEEDGHGEALH